MVVSGQGELLRDGNRVRHFCIVTNRSDPQGAAHDNRFPTDNRLFLTGKSGKSLLQDYGSPGSDAV